MEHISIATGEFACELFFGRRALFLVRQHPRRRGGNSRTPYSPVNSGLRRSTKAATASRRSAVMLVTIS